VKRAVMLMYEFEHYRFHINFTILTETKTQWPIDMGGSKVSTISPCQRFLKVTPLKSIFFNSYDQLRVTVIFQQ
jgi:hypothetical protein